MLGMDHLPLQQSSAFAGALRAFGSTVVSDNPVVLQRRFGPLGRVDFASRLPIRDLAARPRIVNGEEDAPTAYRTAGYRQILTPAHVALWDLTAEDLTRAMTGAWRNQLRKAQASNLRIIENVWTGGDHWLFSNAEALARARRFKTYPTSLLAAFAQTNRGKARLFEAWLGETPFAACLTLSHGPTATYQTAWTSTEGRSAEAGRLLLHAAALRLRRLGHQTFDLGLVETDHAPGLARFKLGTGAELRRLGGTWLRLS